MTTFINRFLSQTGERMIRGVEELGYIAALLVESIYWSVLGQRKQQPVRLSAVFNEAMQIGVNATPIVVVLCFAVGVMLAIQSIETLKTFGAESKVIIGVALSVTREFSPLIVGILVAGRSGSSITARIGSMKLAQEIDALCVIGINPVRYLVAPVLLAMVVMVPTLTILGDLAGIFGGAIFSAPSLDMSMGVYIQRTISVLSVDDIYQGLVKSFVFAIIIALIGVSNGFQVRGGAEAVGRATTRSVVLAISCIVLADMVFTYFLNR